MGLTIYTGRMFSDNISPENINETNKISDKKNSSSFYVGNSLTLDPIEQKRKEAQEKAWKVVSDAWNIDIEIDEMIRNLENDYSDLQTSKKEALDSLEQIDKNMAHLMEAYEIDPQSQEQKDLELLIKKQNYSNGIFTDDLTAEDIEAFKDIHMDNLTDYQKEMLELNSVKIEYTKEIDKIDSAMKEITSGISSIQIDRLKSHHMADANKEADAIMEAASKEIMGMLKDEVKETIDEKAEEAKEETEKAADEKEQKEEVLKEIKEEQAMQEALITETKEAIEKAKSIREENNRSKIDIQFTDMLDIQSMATQTTTVAKSLDEIKNSMNLIEADLQGIKFDEIV